MAKALNKSRIQYSKLALLTAIVLMLFGREFWAHETVWHETLDFTGYFLIAICALGRLFSTAFLGGFKNDNLITYGAFSVVRNPLYFFSLIGITGIAFMTNHIAIIIGLPLFFYFLYIALIKREESFLKEKFGKKYEKYMQEVPRLIPNFSLYHAPESITVYPNFLVNAFKDAIWWFAAFPLVELAEALHDLKILKEVIPF